jgi:hypothetical protein
MTGYTEFSGSPMLIVEQGSMPPEELVLFLHVLRAVAPVTIRSHSFAPDSLIIEFPAE